MDRSFNHHLHAVHRSWLRGLATRALLQGTAIGALALLLAAALDLAQPWSDAARPRVAIFLLLPPAAVFLRGLLGMRHHGLLVTARRVDEALASPRGVVLAATELATVPTEGLAPMTAMLRDRAIHRATSALATVPGRGRLPAAALRRAGFAAFAAFLVLALLAAIFPAPVGTAVRRLVFPTADIPPYSPYTFTLSDPNPKVHYGEDILLGVTIGGAPADAAVWAQARDRETGVVSRARCFRASNAGFFTHRLEKVVGPVDLSFGVEKARSQWFPVEVLYQPKISAADVEITPPAYTGLAVERFPLGSKELRALEGSRVALRLSSNRRLSRGTLSITPANERLRERLGEKIEVTPPSTHDLTFVWTMKASASLRIDIADTRGTSAAAPMELAQTALPDNPPAADIADPPPMSLATPESILPLDLRADDDIGLGRVDLVRSLVGLRDRAQRLADGPMPASFNRKQSLDLASLGARTGDTLEFYLEAADRNPSLMGVSTSGVARVQIISQEDYAAIIRTRTTVEEFTARYHAVMDAMEAARKALEALDKAAASGDAEATAAAAKAAAEATAAAKQLLEKIAADFPAFAMEKELMESARSAAKPLEEIAAALQALGPAPDAAAARKVAGEAMRKLGAATQPLAQNQQDAEQVAKAGKVLELAAALREIHANQKSLAERMTTVAKELARGIDTNAAQLEGLSRLQADNSRRLQETRDALEARAKDLPPELGTFKAGVDEFLEDLDNAQIPNLMDEAAKAAAAGRSMDACTNAIMALQSLDMLFRGQNCMGSACRGGDGLKFDLRQNLSQTLKEMMDALNSRPGQGQGKGPGIGQSGQGGGGSGSGFSMPGPNLPAFGPPRLQFGREGSGRGGDGKGDGGKGGGEANQRVISGQAKLDATRDNAAQPPPPDRVPEKYRDAVKRFYSGEKQTQPEP